MSGRLWTATEIAAATGGRAGADFALAGIAIDSRSVQPGELFVALRGPRHDGHTFVAAAIKRGAAALVDHLPPGVSPTAPLIMVADTMAALTALGVAARARSQARIAAITGSVGKTGVKEALRLALAQQASTHASAASHNNHWGVPLSLAREPHGTTYAVYELGMNAPGEIAQLARLARPHVAVITAIEAAHLGFFESLAAIAEAKGEIFQGLEPDGIAVINADTPHRERLEDLARAAGCARVLTFGTAPEAAVRLRDARPGPDGSEVRAALEGHDLEYRIGAPGRHWMINSLAVVACAHALGADPERAAQALARFTAPAGRGARHRIELPGGAMTLIDDAYNANPASMRAALSLLEAAPGRKLAVLGDMLELGAQGAALHQALVGPVAAAGVDLVFTVGPLMGHLHEALPQGQRGAHAETSDQLGPALLAAVRAGDTVLVKGSLGSRMGVLVEALLAAHREVHERRAGGVHVS